MGNKTINTEQGHWILAKMGKKVLRPGGRELTHKLIAGMKISDRDSIVEFAPGMGYTTTILLKKNPKSYTGIELNQEAAERLRAKISGPSTTVVNASAADTGIKDASVYKVIGEAMLTMQAHHRKSEIIREAYRILKKDGIYGIHELGLQPNGLDADIKGAIQKNLAEAIKVNARPLTRDEWSKLLENEGFKIKEVSNSPMHLLKPKRVIQDEGFFRTLRIGFNVLTHPKARKRILKMRGIFKKYEKEMSAFAIIAQK